VGKSTGVFASFARKMWEHGFSVMPVDGQRPVVSEWDRLHDQLASENQMDLWEREYGHLGIGLVCGKANGLVGVDLDIKDPTLLAAARRLLPPSPLVKIGSKGFTLFVKFSGQTNGKIRYKGKVIGEFMSTGAQTVVPPSIHPKTGKPYVWTSSGNLVDFSRDELMEELPDFTDDDLRRFELALEGENITADEASFKELIGRNNRLKAICGALFERGLTPDFAHLLLFEQDIQLHGEKALFSDKSEMGGLAEKPKVAAWRFCANIYQTYLKNKVQRKEKIPQLELTLADEDNEHDEYFTYRDFFEEHLKRSKKDIISGRLLRFDGQQWQSVLIHLDAIKSYAQAKGLKPHKIQMHLDRFILKKKAELLINIPAWDGVDRVAALKDYLTIKNQKFEVFEAAFKEWGSNIFRRLYHDGAQNRCIILKGGQGIGKDYLLKSMFKAFGPYYAKFSSNRDEREAWTQVTGRMVLHVEEFDQTGQLSVPFLKDLITRDWVTYRAPYDRDAATKKCIGSFISTVNIDAVLRDETGNRRFAVFELDKIKWEYPTDWSEQVLAQFKALYEADYVAPEDTWKSVAEGNAQYEQVDMVPEYLSFWDARVAAISKQKRLKELTFADVDGVVGDLSRQSGWRAKAVCSMLKTNSRSRHTKFGTVYWSNTYNLTDHQ
jgi:hypothetical protein